MIFKERDDPEGQVVDVGSAAAWSWVRDTESGQSNGARAQLARVLGILQENEDSEGSSQAYLEHLHMLAAQQGLSNRFAQQGARQMLVASRIGLGEG